MSNPDSGNSTVMTCLICGTVPCKCDKGTQYSPEYFAKREERAKTVALIAASLSKDTDIYNSGQVTGLINKALKILEEAEKRCIPNF